LLAAEHQSMIDLLAWPLHAVSEKIEDMIGFVGID
jgi:hypothetical protein